MCFCPSLASSLLAFWPRRSGAREVCAGTAGRPSAATWGHKTHATTVTNLSPATLPLLLVNKGWFSATQHKLPILLFEPLIFRAAL